MEVYRACKTCNDEDYQRAADGLSSFHMVLIDIRDNLTRDATGLTHSRADSLKKHLNNGYTATQDLERLVQNFEKMPFDGQRKFSLLRWGLDGAVEAGTQLTSATTALRDIEVKMMSDSQSRVEKFVVKYLREIAEGLHERSVLNLVPGDEVDKKRNWEQFVKELQELGISTTVLREHSDFIQAVVRRAREGGMLDPSMDMEIPAQEPDVTNMTRQVDDEFKNRVANRSLSLEDLLSKKRQEHAEGKKFSPLVSLCLRALRIVSDERLIEAADEGDEEKVRYLIRAGGNVNATDKWLWTALHMAAYGGFDKIAEELISAGAKIDVRTVDGETPLNLAERNGHGGVYRVIMDQVERLQSASEAGSQDTIVC